MQVKEIHFVDVVPGQPIYVMINGEIRMPFPDGATKQLLWLNEADVLKSLVVRDPSNKTFISTQFDLVRKAIRK